MTQRSIFMWLVMCCACMSVESIIIARLRLKNFSSKDILVHIKKLGAFGVDDLAQDYLGAVKSGDLLKQTGDIEGVLILPTAGIMVPEDFEEEMNLIAQNPQELTVEQRTIGKNMLLYQRLGKAVWDMSFDIDSEGHSYLYFGRQPLSEPFKMLLISDVHTIAKTEAEIQTMDLRYYGGDARRDTVLKKHRAKIALRDKMIEYIADKDKNITAVIMPGDLAGGYGKKSEKEAFVDVWWSPVRAALLDNKAHIFAGIGNHDTYWDGFFEPFPTKMLEFLKEKYRDYLYSFNLGPVRCIHLGSHPAIGEQKGGFKDFGALVKNSTGYLQEELKYVRADQPVIIFFHYPTQGSMSDWWSAKDKGAFYDVIKDYNVLAMLCGHAHGSAIFMFKDKIPMIRAAGSEFAELSFDPAKPKELDVVFVNADGVRTPGAERMRRSIEEDAEDYLPCACEGEEAVA